MSRKKPKKTPIQRTAEEVQEALGRHIRENTAEEDERKEAERDARVREALRQLAEDGTWPPKPKAETPP